MAAPVKTMRNGLLQSPSQWLFEHQIGMHASLLLTTTTTENPPSPIPHSPSPSSSWTKPANREFTKGVACNLLLSLFFLHACSPQWRPSTSKFFTLSYYNPATGKYALGHDDLYIVGFCVVLFSGIRAGSMEYVLAPLARHCGLTNKKRITRFSEQGWMFMYNSVFWTLGMVRTEPTC